MTQALHNRLRTLSPQKLVLLVQQLQEQLERAERAIAEPIAIIGLGCRFPGARNPEEFWQLLHTGTDAITDLPPHRRHPPGDGRGGGEGLPPLPGGFLTDIDLFDARLFGISPREAATMDPQQRLLLEVTWEALEHAAIAPDRLLGTRTGVFVGISGIDFAQILLAGDPSSLDLYTASGASHAIASGRVSYSLGLQGPSVSLDTACSSSLVAVHLACQSLRSGDCTMALAGGVNLILTPEVTISLSRGGMLAPNGRCKTFDARADGFARSEGCGVVVLKRLSDAERCGDRILAVIRGSAVNQDGRSGGITAPNGPAQESVIRDAIDRAGVKPSDIDYVEAHGTGTALGDPIEIRALGSALGPGRDPRHPLLVGSVKTNIGHLEAAAGIAGLLKVVLALEHEEMPQHLHFETPNPHIGWDELPLRVVRESTSWRRGARPRLAGASSFGFSGTNAHVVIEEAPPRPPRQSTDRPLHILTISANSSAALDDLSLCYASMLGAPDAPLVGDLCFTANTGRAQLPHRLAVIGASAAELRAKLAVTGPGIHAPRAIATSDPPAVAFLFTGQGSQYVGMGRELFETQPAFRRAMERCDAILKPHLELSILDVLYPHADHEAAQDAVLSDTRLAQPAIFALEYCLAELWQTWGIRPAAVIGHSLGEYVAACVAGVLALEDALPLVAVRGRLMSGLGTRGAMAAVFVDEERAAATIAPYRSTLAIAAVNGPAHVVLSGAHASLEAVLTRFAGEGVIARRLNTSEAFHSPLIEPILPLLQAEAATIPARAPRVEFISTLTGETETAAPAAGHWARQARQPVRFWDGVRRLRASGCSALLEIGPHPVLLGIVREAGPDDDCQCLPSLRRGGSDWQQMLESLGALWRAGCPVDWSRFDEEYARTKVVAPLYPFERQPHWPDMTRRAGGDRAPRPVWEQWLYETRWTSLPVAPAMPQEAPLVPTSELAGRVGAIAPALVQEHGAEVYDSLYPLLDRACSAYIVDAFRRLGWSPRVGDVTSLSGHMNHLGVRERHRSLVRRMLDILDEDGVLERLDDSWRVVSVPAADDPRTLMADLLRRFPACRGELNLTARCAERIAEVLQERCDPMQLLFPDGSLEHAEALYQHSPGFRLFNTLVAQVCTAAIRRASAARPVRVLEIGAGTGGTTAYVLEALAGGAVHYTFTDVSRTFTTRARAKFAAAPDVEYRTLDIEQDPAAQGFRIGSFDIVLASNVLHATANLRTTLRHVHDLLSPGGLLVLLEGTRPQRFGDLSVGLTEGWWRFDDDVRTDYALLPAERWIRLLREAGFDTPHAAPVTGDTTAAVLQNQAVIIARTPAAAPPFPARIEVDPDTVVFGGGEQGAALAARLQRQGRRAIHLATDTELPGGDHASSWSEGVGQIRRLLDSTLARAREITLVDMRALSVVARTDLTPDTRAAILCRGVAALVQAATTRSGPPVRLVVVTSGAHAVNTSDGPPDPSQSSLWGLGRVIMVEHPELSPRLADLDRTVKSIDALAELLLEDPAEGEVALRGGLRYAVRLVRPEPSSIHDTPAFRGDASYLITGGLKGLGVAVAEWMAAHGARHLVLASRHPPLPNAADAIARLRASGIDVVVSLTDVSSRQALKALLDGIDPGVPLRGVMHCAGTIDDASLSQMTPAQFDRVLAAKAAGTWHLHELTAGLALDFFVLFSSGAAVLGSHGQANHAAANAFLDGMAHLRQHLGLPALSINWGAWSRVGAAAHGGVLERVETHGSRRIDPADGLAALGHLMAGAAVQACVVPIVWNEFFKVAQGRERHIYDGFRGPESGATYRSRSQSVDLAALRTFPPARVRAILTAAVEREAASILGIEPGVEIDPQQPLNQLGLDSLMAVELRTALGQLIGQPQPATLLFNYPTTGELVEYFAAQVLGADASAARCRGSETVESAPAFDALSEDELEALLARRLSGAS